MCIVILYLYMTYNCMRREEIKGDKDKEVSTSFVPIFFGISIILLI